jgi:hypothetical protein
MEKLKLLLAYRQDDGVTNVAYYDQFKTRVDVIEHIVSREVEQTILGSK